MSRTLLLPVRSFGRLPSSLIPRPDGAPETPAFSTDFLEPPPHSLSCEPPTVRCDASLSTSLLRSVSPLRFCSLFTGGNT